MILFHYKNGFFSCLLLVVALLPLYAEEVSSFTLEANRAMAEGLLFEDVQDFTDAAHGFIAPIPNGGVIKNRRGEIVWDLTRYQFLESSQAENDPSAPQTVNPSLWRQARLLQQAGLFQVTEGIYQVRGADISNMTIIEGKAGIIIIDPLLSTETARVALDLYYAHRPKKPIVAVLYSHSHADHFGGVKGVVTAEEVKSGKVRIIAPEGFTKAALSENVMAGNVMSRRALYMYGSLIEPGVKGQVTAGLGLTLSAGEVGFIAPTEFIKMTGQTLLIDGLTFIFLMAPDSEAPAEMLFYIPEKKALCAAEDATHNMHNLYTLRGAKIRDSRAWASYLNQAIEMFGRKAEVVFAQHQWPRWGNERVIDFLEKQRDMFKFIHDQALHFANQGYTMMEIGEMIEMPESLSREWYNRGYYGSLNHNAKSVYVFYLGWFDGNPSTLHALPEVAASKKYVEYMGGKEAILIKARRDFGKGEYRWVAEVLNHLVFAEPHDQKVKDFLADTLTQLAYQSENATWRNFYLTGAKELRLGVQKNPVGQGSSLDIVASLPVPDFLDYLAIRLNGMRASQMPLTLNLYLTDTNERYLIQIKNGVLNYFPGKRDKKAPLALSLKKLEFYALFSSPEKSRALIHSRQVQLHGSQQTFEQFQSLFDQFNPAFNIVEPQVASP